MATNDSRPRSIETSQIAHSRFFHALTSSQRRHSCLIPRLRDPARRTSARKKRPGHSSRDDTHEMSGAKDKDGSLRPG